MLIFLICLLILILILCVILPIFFYKKLNNYIEVNCSINKYNTKFRGDGFTIVNNILDENCRKKIVNIFLKKHDITKI